MRPWTLVAHTYTGPSTFLSLEATSTILRAVTSNGALDTQTPRMSTQPQRLVGGQEGSPAVWGSVSDDAVHVPLFDFNMPRFAP